MSLRWWIIWTGSYRIGFKSATKWPRSSSRWSRLFITCRGTRKSLCIDLSQRCKEGMFSKVLSMDQVDIITSTNNIKFSNTGFLLLHKCPIQEVNTHLLQMLRSIFTKRVLLLICQLVELLLNLAHQLHLSHRSNRSQEWTLCHVQVAETTNDIRPLKINCLENEHKNKIF